MIIRKISVGPDFKNSMNYSVGQRVISDDFSVSEILKDDTGITIWVQNKNSEKMAWKHINMNMPVVIENDLAFAL